MKAYRVWFADGSAMLVDAESELDADRLAAEQIVADGDPDLVIDRIECLDENSS